jgi:hypothetical protein
MRLCIHACAIKCMSHVRMCDSAYPRTGGFQGLRDGVAPIAPAGRHRVRCTTASPASGGEERPQNRVFPATPLVTDCPPAEPRFTTPPRHAQTRHYDRWHMTRVHDPIPAAPRAVSPAALALPRAGLAFPLARANAGAVFVLAVCHT